MLKFLSGWIVGLATIPAIVIVGVTMGAGHLGESLQRNGEAAFQAQAMEAFESAFEDGDSDHDGSPRSVAEDFAACVMLQIEANGKTAQKAIDDCLSDWDR